MSMQEYGLPQVFGQPAPWVGFANFRTILEDDYFWTVLWRTLIFCFVNVALTMVLGVLIALLLDALGKGMRLLVSASLIVAWAMPALTATIVWQWMFDTEYGLVNWALDRQGESWFANQLTFFMVATIIVVWMGVPFIAFTVYAALTQIPGEMVEAARLDGARFRDIFRYVVAPGPQADPADPHVAVGDLGLPRVHPDLRAAEGGRDHPRHQPARRLRLPHLDRREPLRHRCGRRRRHGADHGDPDDGLPPRDAAGRRSCEQRAERAAVRSGSRSTRPAPSSPLVALFPVYWMVLTSFKRNSEVRTLTPSFLPTNPTLDNYRTVFERDFFWTAMRNSAMVTVTVVFLALTIAFFAAVAISRFRFRGRKAFIIAVIVIQMVPAEALIISLFQVLDGRQLTNRIIGLSLTYLIFVLPFTIWTLRGFVVRRAARAGGGRPRRRRQPLRCVHAGDAAA